MTRWLGIVATLVSIAAVSLVLRWGTSGRAGTPPFEMAVLTLNVAVPLASILLTWHLWRDGRRGGALLSSSPLVLMLIGTVLAISGSAPSFKVLLWLDLYVLLVFIVVLSGFGREVLRQTSVPASRHRPAV